MTDVRGTVIRLFSPQGTLVVEVDDPGVSVAIKDADMVITGAGAKEIRLKAVQYKVEASRDGKLLSQEWVTVARNGRQVVRISKEAKPGGHAAKGPAPREKSVAEKQVEAVARRLKELNPRFNGEVHPTIENGVMSGLRFLTDEVKDISPVRMLEGLWTLHCSGSYPGKGKLADLTPLRGLRLTILYCWNTHVADLTPLRGMPLTNLGCRETRVSDLAPLKGMRLITLDLNDTEVADLTPLRGMPLDALDLHGTRKVSDPGPLENMPVEYLNLSYLTVADLSVLASMKRLRHLVLTSVPVSDLTPLRGLPLDILAIEGTRAKDLTPLKGKHIIALALDYRPGDEKILRSLPWLKPINRKPAVEFWKEVSGK